MRMDFLSTGLYDCAGRRVKETERRGGSRDDQYNKLYEHCMKVFTWREGMARITVGGLLYISTHQVQRRACDEIFVETKKCSGVAHVRVSRFAAFSCGTQPVAGRNLRRWARWGRMRGGAVLARLSWVAHASRLLGKSTVDRGAERVGCQSMYCSGSRPSRSRGVFRIQRQSQRCVADLNVVARAVPAPAEPMCRSAVKRGGLMSACQQALMVMRDVGTVMPQYPSEGYSRHAPMTSKGDVPC